MKWNDNVLLVTSINMFGATVGVLVMYTIVGFL